MGTLAGSTIMLLTLPWAASLFLARTDIVRGVSVDGKRTITGLAALTGTGTTVDPDTKTNARIAVLSSLLFWFTQGVAFAYIADPDNVLLFLLRPILTRFDRLVALSGLWRLLVMLFAG